MIEQFFLDNFTDIRLERTGEILKGFFSDNSIQLISDTPIHPNDTLTHCKTGNHYTVRRVVPLTDNEYQLFYSAPSAGINIGTIHGNAIVGSQQTATFSIGSNLAEIGEYIHRSAEIQQADRQQLQELLDLTAVIIRENRPLTGGSFSRFSPLFTKYGTITGAIIQSITQWLISR